MNNDDLFAAWVVFFIVLVIYVSGTCICGGFWVP